MNNLWIIKEVIWMILFSPSPTSPQWSTYLLKLFVTSNQYAPPSRSHEWMFAEQWKFKSLTRMFAAEGNVLPPCSSLQIEQCPLQEPFGALLFLFCFLLVIHCLLSPHPHMWCWRGSMWRRRLSSTGSPFYIQHKEIASVTWNYGILTISI